MDERRKDLCLYRMKKARNCLESANILMQSGDYCGAANRSYYGIFHCIRSLLALKGVDFSKHSGVMAYFQKEYIKSGIFKKDYSKILTEAFEMRSDADYDDYYVLSKEEVEEQLQNAELFLTGVEEYIDLLFSAEN